MVLQSGTIFILSQEEVGPLLAITLPSVGRFTPPNMELDLAWFWDEDVGEPWG